MRLKRIGSLVAVAVTAVAGVAARGDTDGVRGGEPAGGAVATVPQKPRAVPKDRPKFWLMHEREDRIVQTKPPAEFNKDDPKLPPVLKFFGEGGWAECQADVRVLTALDPATIPELTAMLGAPSWKANIVVPLVTETEGKEKKVVVYCDGTRIGGRLVQEAAAAALGWIGPEAAPAVPDLLHALEDADNRSLRFTAAAALGWIGLDAREAGPALARHLRTDDNTVVRANCAIALGEVDPEAEATISALKAEVQAAERLVRNAAAESLKRLARAPR